MKQTPEFPTSKIVALTSVMTALVYATTCISVPMPKPLGVWHIGDIASFVVAFLCGPLIGAFACGVGAMLFDVWNPLWGGAFVSWAPATIVIRGFMGFLLGKLRRIFPERPMLSELVAMILAATQKNFCYFLYDYVISGPAAFLDLVTFFPLSAVDIIVTIPLLVSVRKTLKIEYLV
jgi:uncharacterized membrane protein